MLLWRTTAAEGAEEWLAGIAEDAMVGIGGTDTGSE